ncbi:MAG: NAD-dependent succinate-semialdehyde dehydrogenase [Acidiferrobacteraceae bacterium]|jgi:succinate-semialdehyde dehydrogenase/glutarate-semialdehyde dehydrogenase|nr:NAD-dependent succinate-semialdehyde dehydrogenase [Acidiferrobacteraceae bacterium]|tara:strand:- start:1295 stop:2728 length:1434 start_codon:yes stop_codon:yes gene_type:complete
MKYTNLELFINGEWLSGEGRKTETVLNPATEESLGELPHATETDLDNALEAAKIAFDTWKNTSPLTRANILRDAGKLLRERQQSIGQILTLEEGKVLDQAVAEIVSCAETLEWFAEEGRRAFGRVIPARDIGLNQMTLPEPVGPVAAFVAWNFPGTNVIRKIAASLAAGCSCIMKASEETPGTCIEIARALDDAGLPKGVLNLVFGVPAEISEYLIDSPVVRKVSFIGSIPVGKHLTKLAASHMKRTTMELGGHAPVIIFDDVDVEAVAKQAVATKYRNAGQVCISPTRFFVHENIYEDFVNCFTDLVNEITVGNGLESNVQMGPLANHRRLDAMEYFVEDALKQGARLTTGGERIGKNGYFFQPTVFADVPDSARIMTEEPFGPIAPIQKWSDIDEVVDKANSLPFGLAAYAFTSSAANVQLISRALEAGMVGVNHFGVTVPETPFGGVKESGHGYECGSEGLEGYLVTKYVSHKM